MQSEITVEVLCDKETLFSLLKKKGFKYVDLLEINDYYYTHLPATEKISFRELIANSFLIRCLRHKNLKNKRKSTYYTRLVYKKKGFDSDNNVVNEKKIVCELSCTSAANEIFQLSGLLNWCTKPINGYGFYRGKQYIFIQEVEDLGLFLEIEQYPGQSGTEDEILDELVELVNELEIPVGENYHESIAYRIFKTRKKNSVLNFKPNVVI